MVTGDQTFNITKVDGTYLYINGYYVDPSLITSFLIDLSKAQLAAASQAVVARSTGSIDLLVANDKTIITSKLLKETRF